MFSIDPDNPTIEEAKEILAKVSLKSFTAAPGDIGPFGTSLLSWDVEGPPAISVYLNRGRVHTRGEKAVQPKSTTQYALRAAAGRASKKLGTATVNVNLTGCTTSPGFNVRWLIEGAIRTGVNSTPDLYFRPQSPGVVVTVEPGRIRFRLYLGFHLDDKPDPDIDIDASFGLDIQDGAFVARDDKVNASVRVPLYVWLLPGSPIWLPLLLDNAHQDATRAAQATIQGVVQALNLFFVPSEGMRLQNVQIEAEEDGEGDLVYTECPYDLLRRFAALSALATLVETTGK